MDVKEITAKAIQQEKTVYQLAKVMGVRWQTVHDWKTGKRVPRGNNLLKLLEISGKSLAVLLIASCLFAANISPSYAASPETYYSVNELQDNYVKYTASVSSDRASAADG